MKVMGTFQERLLIIAITVLHVFFCFFHYNNASGKGLDVDRFYNQALNASSWFDLFGTGSISISFLSYPLVKLGCSMLSLFVLWSVVSYTGYMLLLKLFNFTSLSKIKQLAVSFLFLLPSLHYWSAFYGKEALLFFIMVFLIEIIKGKNFKNPFLYIFLALILLIRPYLFFILVLAFLCSIINEKKFLKNKKKVLAIGSIFLLISIPILIKFLRIDSLKRVCKNFQHLHNYAALNGGSSINLLESFYFERFFLVLFRPLFFDAHTYFQYWVSLENLLVIILLIILLYKQSNVFKISQPLVVKFCLYSGVLVILFLSVYMYNLGLASRMRVMFVPYLMYALVKNNKN
jgi:hypothetical protein